MKKRLLAAMMSLFALAVFAQQPCTFKDGKTVIDTIHDVYNGYGEVGDVTFYSTTGINSPATSRFYTLSNKWITTAELRPYGDSRFVENTVRYYPYKNYIFQSDSAGTVNWMLLCPDPADERCSVFQRTIAGGTVEYKGLRFRPGQEVHLKAQPYQTAKIASFDDFNGGATSYPVIIFDQPYYNVFYLGYWSYLPESVLEE